MNCEGKDASFTPNDVPQQENYVQYGYTLCLKKRVSRVSHKQKLSDKIA